MDRRGVKNVRRVRNAPVRAAARALMAARRGPMVAPRQLALNKQVRALIAAKKRDAADVTRSTASLTVTTLACATSSTNFATAASGTGLLDMDGDECMVNSIRLKGALQNPATLDLDPASNVDTVIRKLVVWFNKPLLVASAAGTLPPITEVLISDTIDSLPVTAAANGGRFVILSDRKWNLGINSYQATTAVGHARVQGKTLQYYDYTVKVGKMIKFKTPAQSGSAAGGHYDTDVAAGQVDRGLIVIYTQVLNSGNNPQDTGYTRLNYTG